MIVAGVVASIPAFIVLISMAIIWFSLTPLNVVPLAFIVILTPPVAVYARVFYLVATKLPDESCEGGQLMFLRNQCRFFKLTACDLIYGRSSVS